MKLSCPACGAEVVFKSRFSNFGVCSFCQSSLVRNDQDWKNIGKMAELPENMSPLQVGTTGSFDGEDFEIIGRQRIGWDEGYWNEWYLHFDNGKDAWIADAQGFYLMSFQVLGTVEIPELSRLKISDRLDLAGNDYLVEDIRLVTCVGSEGELPVQSISGRESTSVDLAGVDRIFANIDYATEGNRLFFGRYEDFESFNFKNLREIDGW